MGNLLRWMKQFYKSLSQFNFPVGLRSTYAEMCFFLSMYSFHSIVEYAFVSVPFFSAAFCSLWKIHLPVLTQFKTFLSSNSGFGFTAYHKPIYRYIFQINYFSLNWESCNTLFHSDFMSFTFLHRKKKLFITILYT